MSETVTEWSLRMWRGLHDKGYFPNSVQHKGWRIYEDMPAWFHQYAQPTTEDDALEIGAGYGEWMVPLSRLVRSVAGVDIHKIPVDKAAEIFAASGVTNARCLVNDGQTLPFRDEAFSLVYSISVFQHLPRVMVHGYMAESARVVTPTGRIVHYFRSPKHTSDGVSQPVEDFTVGHKGDFCCGWTMEQVRDAAEAVGLRCEVHDLDLWFILVGRK